MEMPKPSEAHHRLQRMAGEWVGDEKIHPSPWDPNGGSAIGRVHNRLALEGFAVIQDYEQERDGRVNFAGHGIFRWDPLEQCYILYWFDSMGMPPNIFKGTFDARVLKLVSKNGQGHSRAVFDFSKENQYDYRMEVSPDGTQWYLFMNGIYRRSV